MAQIDLRLVPSGNKARIRAIAVLKNSLCEQESFAGSGKLDVWPALFG